MHDAAAGVVWCIVPTAFRRRGMQKRADLSACSAMTPLLRAFLRAERYSFSGERTIASASWHWGTLQMAETRACNAMQLKRTRRSTAAAAAPVPLCTLFGILGTARGTRNLLCVIRERSSVWSLNSACRCTRSIHRVDNLINEIMKWSPWVTQSSLKRNSYIRCIL